MKKYYAELIGTFVLTFLGCGAAVSLNCGADTASIVGTAIAFGLAVVAMAYTIGGISGCHINPAITLGVYLSGRMNAKDCGMYMLFQVIGAIIAAALLYVIVQTDPGLARGTTTGANACASGNIWNGVVVEFALTFIFVLVVLACTDPYPPRGHQLYRYFCEPCPQYRSRSLRGRRRSGTVADIHLRSIGWRCSRCWCVETLRE